MLAIFLHISFRFLVVQSILRGLEEKLKTVQLALEILTGVCATLPDPSFDELEQDRDGGDDDEGWFLSSVGTQSRLEILIHMFYRLHGFNSWYIYLMNGLSHIVFDSVEKIRNCIEEKVDGAEVNAVRADLLLSSLSF